jgi:predicted Zn-dependent protease
MKPGAWLVILLIGTSALGIARVQPRLAAELHDVARRDDVYLLPPPDELGAMTLGYRAAAADAVWAKLIVEYGTHWQEKRSFTEAPRYLDAILALEPTYSLVYTFADTLICYRSPRGTEEDWYTAKRYLERGTRERAWDHQVWLHYGQFLAFTSLTFLSDKQEIEKYRREGAFALVRAVELGADADRSITAATLLTKYGEKDAAIRQLRNSYMLTEDPADRELILQKLSQLEATTEREAAERDTRFIEARWRKEYGFLSRDAYLLLGPIPNPLGCAGRDPRIDRPCPRDWSQALDASRK